MASDKNHIKWASTAANRATSDNGKDSARAEASCDDEVAQQMREMTYTQIVNDLRDALGAIRPTDIYAFCCDYFAKLRKKIPGYGVDGCEEPTGNRMNLKIRRKSFSGVTFDPHQVASIVASSSTSSCERKAKNEAFLLDAFKHISFISRLDVNVQKKLIDLLEPCEVAKDEQVLRQGDEGDYLYIVENGEFVASIEKNGASKEVKHYLNEGCFGELALLHETPRRATVTCVSEVGSLWKMCRFAFKQAVCMHDHEQRQLKILTLSQMSLFADWTPGELDKLSDALTLVEIGARDTVVVRQGAHADAMYLIMEGEVRFERDGDDGGAAQTAGPGDYFGEVGLVRNCKRQMTVVTQSETAKLLRLDANQFRRLMGKCHEKLDAKIAQYAPVGAAPAI